MLIHREDDLFVDLPPFARIIQKDGSHYYIAGEPTHVSKSEAVGSIIEELRKQVTAYNTDIAALTKYKTALASVEQIEQSQNTPNS